MNLKVAILEDNKELLKDLHRNLKESGLVDVIVWATNSGEFLEKVKASNPDALLLDIDLGGDSMSGMDVAYKLKLPVLFVSGHNAEYLKEIEHLKREFDLTVDHLTKPFSEKEFIKTVSRFISEVSSSANTNFVHLNFGDTRRNKIGIDTIVYLCADKASGAESNNKQIFFTDRKPEVLIDFTFRKMEEIGFKKNKFITIHRSFCVNADKILSYNKITHQVEVPILNSVGKLERKLLPVSENYRNDVSRFKK